MLDAILVTNAFDHANHASMLLGWFRANLVVNLLLATFFSFWPWLEPWDFLAFIAWD
jgi:hypothetical protein